MQWKEDLIGSGGKQDDENCFYRHALYKFSYKHIWANCRGYESLSELFNIEIEGFCIGAVKERLISCDRDSELRGLLGVFNLRDYINAGVLLFNLIEIEKEGLSEKLEEAGHRTEYPHNDQDVINAVFHNRIHLLPIRFNAINTYLYDRKKDTENEYGSEAIQQARKDPIIHYIGECKPCTNPAQIPLFSI